MRTIVGLARIAVILSTLAAVASCADVYRNHGYVPPNDALSAIDVGATRQEVALAIGPPTATGLVDEDGWYYVKSRYRNFAWRAPEEVDREVVAISFESNAVVNIERFGLEDGRVVPLSRRVTERNTTGIPFLRQLFGNLGNFDPTQFFGGE